jgi:flagellar protein FlbD
LIRLTHFNGQKYYLNADIIISVESTPDTVITMMNDQKVLVKEKADEVVKKIVAYKRLIYNPQLEINTGD